MKGKEFLIEAVKDLGWLRYYSRTSHISIKDAPAIIVETPDDSIEFMQGDRKREVPFKDEMYDLFVMIRMPNEFKEADWEAGEAELVQKSDDVIAAILTALKTETGNGIGRCGFGKGSVDYYTISSKPYMGMLMPIAVQTAKGN